MHKKGLAEEITKKRTRKTVKHQRGIVGADIAAITARRNQSTQVRAAARVDAIAKAKALKKEKEAKKAKVCSIFFPLFCLIIGMPERGCVLCRLAGSPTKRSGPKNLQAADEGWEERSLEKKMETPQLFCRYMHFWEDTCISPLPSFLHLMYIHIPHALSCPICYAMELTSEWWC